MDAGIRASGADKLYLATKYGLQSATQFTGDRTLPRLLRKSCESLASIPQSQH